MPVREEAGTGTIHLAFAGRRRRDDYPGSARLFARRHRLADAPPDLETRRGGLSRPRRAGAADCLGPAASGPAAAYAPAMPLATTGLPGNLAAAHAMILLERAARLEAEAAVSSARLEIERLRLLLAKARRARDGQSAARGAKPGEQPQL